MIRAFLELKLVFVCLFSLTLNFSTPAIFAPWSQPTEIKTLHHKFLSKVPKRKYIRKTPSLPLYPIAIDSNKHQIKVLQVEISPSLL